MTNERGKEILEELFDHGTGQMIFDWCQGETHMEERAKAIADRFFERAEAMGILDELDQHEFALALRCFTNICEDAFQHFRGRYGPHMEVQE